MPDDVLIGEEKWTLTSSSASNWPITINITPQTIQRISFTVPSNKNYIFNDTFNSGSNDYLYWISTSNSNYEDYGYNNPRPFSGWVYSKGCSEDTGELVEEGEATLSNDGVSLKANTTYYLYCAHNDYSNDKTTNISIARTVEGEPEPWTLSSQSSISSWPINREIQPNKVYRSSFTVSSTGNYEFEISLNSGNNDYIFWISTSNNSYQTDGNNSPEPTTGILGSGGGNEYISEGLEESNDSTTISLNSNVTYYLYYSHSSGTNTKTSNVTLNCTYQTSSSSSSDEDDPLVEEAHWSVSNMGTVYNWPISVYANNYVLYQYKFVPDTTGSYTFTASSDTDTYGWLSESSKAYNSSNFDDDAIYNIRSNDLVYNDDSNGSSNFKLQTTLTKGKTYYLYFGIYSSAYNPATIEINKTGGGTSTPGSSTTPGSTTGGSYPSRPSDSAPVNSSTKPNESSNYATYTQSSDGKKSSTTSIDTDDSYTATDSSSNKVNTTLLNSLIDGWNYICQKRIYYGNINSERNTISKVSPQTSIDNTNLNNLINAYNKYFTPHYTISVVNDDRQISKDILQTLKNEFSNSNRTCKQACTGYCSSTNSHSATTQTCQGQCSGGCYSYCSGCSGNCAGTCIGCTGTCKTICTDYCQEACSTHCGSECIGESEGIYGLPGTTGGCSGCDTTCSSNCGNGSCYGQCSKSCSGSCVDSCTDTCRDYCGNNCDRYCDGTCADKVSQGATAFRRDEAHDLMWEYFNNGWSWDGTRYASEWNYSDCSTCSSVCGNGCGGGCWDECLNTCGANCASTCLTECEDKCKTTCDTVCNTGCTNNCAENSSSATSSCSGCDGACGNGCEGKCGNSSCTGKCSGVCKVYCDNVCKDACSTACEEGCQDGAKIRTGNGCREACTSYCQGGCVGACQNSSGGGTSSSGCGGNSCATSCSSYCVTASS